MKLLAIIIIKIIQMTNDILVLSDSVEKELLFNTILSFESIFEYDSVLVRVSAQIKG